MKHSLKKILNKIKFRIEKCCCKNPIFDSVSKQKEIFSLWIFAEVVIELH